MEIKEEVYQRDLSRIKDKLSKAISDGAVLSYTDLGRMLDLDPDYVKEIIGLRFSQLTKKASSSWFAPVDPDFLLIGESIKEIRENKFYKMFKKRINTKNKGSGILGRLMHGGA
jgi:hypothetical protein